MSKTTRPRDGNKKRRKEGRSQNPNKRGGRLANLKSGKKKKGSNETGIASKETQD